MKKSWDIQLSYWRIQVNICSMKEFMQNNHGSQQKIYMAPAEKALTYQLFISTTG